jgi:hypothetical protein
MIPLILVLASGAALGIALGVPPPSSPLRPASAS